MKLCAAAAVCLRNLSSFFLHIFFQFTFDDGDTGAVDNLHAGAFGDHTCRTAFGQQVFLHLTAVLYSDPESGGTAVQGDNIVPAAESFQNQPGNTVRILPGSSGICPDRGGMFLPVIVRPGVQLCFRTVRFSAGGKIVPFLNEEPEQEEIQSEIPQSHQRHHQPVGFGVPLQDKTLASSRAAVVFAEDEGP